MKYAFSALVALLLLSLALVACAQALPDGEYVPERFTFSGGSGRVAITCPLVTVEDGAVTAKIVFDSVKYTRATVDGAECLLERGEDFTAFSVPAPLNRAFSLRAVTEAMSQPHEIEYTLFIALSAGDGASLAGLEPDGELALSYAEQFSVTRYAGGYALIEAGDEARYLIVPEGGEAPEGLDPAITPLYQPLDHIYLAATGAMSLFHRLDALSAVRFSSLKEDDWTVPAAAEAMAKGDIRFGGKYSEPNYELLVREGCDLAVESTMIAHSPKVREMLELLGIPVFVDRSSYETHPLGRAEWIKLYGVMTGREEQAEAFFEAQRAAFETARAEQPSNLSVAFFYLSSDGSAVVRGAGDYLARGIELAGGRYAFSDLAATQGAHASVNLAMEDFYAAALEADYLIYNESIDSDEVSVQALIERCPLLAEFKAVREGRVYGADRALYQATDQAADFVLDVHRLLAGEETGLTFLHRLEGARGT